MNMYKKWILLPLLAVTLSAGAINITDSKVKEVTVYRNYAKETREASATLPAGNSEVVISNVSTQMDNNTLQIATKGNVKILSVSSRNNFLTDKKKSEQSVRLNDSLQTAGDELAWLKEQAYAYQDELTLLNNNRTLSNDKVSFTAAQVKELAELYRVRSVELRKLIFDNGRKQKALNEQITRRKSQLKEWSVNEQWR